MTKALDRGEGNPERGFSLSEWSLPELAEDLRAWIEEAEHYSVVEFAISRGMSKEELIRLGGDDKELGDAIDYAFSVQEYKLAEGALNGVLDRTVALKMLETYNGWKSDVNVLQKNEFRQYMNEAQRKAQEILAGSADRCEEVEGRREEVAIEQ